MTLLPWLENLSISVWVRESLWGFPIVQTLHAVGMAFVVGVITVVNLRLLGLLRTIPIFVLVKMLPLIWIMFAVNAATGLLMYAADATALTSNWVFLVKLTLILAGFVVAQVVRKQVRTGAAQWSEHGVPGSVRALSIASLLIWYAAIFAGRYTAFVAEMQAFA